MNIWIWKYSLTKEYYHELMIYKIYKLGNTMFIWYHLSELINSSEETKKNSNNSLKKLANKYHRKRKLKCSFKWAFFFTIFFGNIVFSTILEIAL